MCVWQGCCWNTLYRGFPGDETLVRSLMFMLVPIAPCLFGLTVGPLCGRPGVVSCCGRAGVTTMSGKPLSDEERAALRLPSSARPEPLPDDSMDPLGGGDEEELNRALFRVRRKAAAGAYNGTASRTLPLVALVAQVGVGALLCAGLLYCYALNVQADAGAAWAVEALGQSDTWWFGTFGSVWGKPPGGPLTLVYAGANGLNALRCAPLLFDRLLVSRLPRSAEEPRDREEEER